MRKEDREVTGKGTVCFGWDLGAPSLPIQEASLTAGCAQWAMLGISPECPPAGPSPVPPRPIRPQLLQIPGRASRLLTPVSSVLQKPDRWPVPVVGLRLPTYGAQMPTQALQAPPPPRPLSHGNQDCRPPQTLSLTLPGGDQAWAICCVPLASSFLAAWPSRAGGVRGSCLRGRVSQLLHIPFPHALFARRPDSAAGLSPVGFSFLPTCFSLVLPAASLRVLLLGLVAVLSLTSFQRNPRLVSEK